MRILLEFRTLEICSENFRLGCKGFAVQKSKGSRRSKPLTLLE